MTGLLQDLRYAMRQLRNTPGFTALAIVTLALGIGATTAIYSVLYATLLAPMPYPNPNQLVMVWLKLREGRNSVSAGDYLDWKRQSSVFQDLSAWSGGSFNLSTTEQPEEVNAQITTPGFYKMMGVRFLLGRDFRPEERELGKHHEVILMHKLFNRSYGFWCGRDCAFVFGIVGLLHPRAPRGQGGSHGVTAVRVRKL